MRKTLGLVANNEESAGFPLSSSEVDSILQKLTKQDIINAFEEADKEVEEKFGDINYNLSPESNNIVYG